MGCRPPEVYWNPRDLALLDEPLRSAMHTGIVRAAEAGHVLYLVSGARSPFQQYMLRGAHGCRGRECDSSCRCHPSTALPAVWNGREWVGGSKHQRGEAADMGGAKWFLHEHQRDLGIHFPVSGEDWHAEWLGNPRWTLLPFGKTQPADPNYGRPWKQINDGDTDARIYARGGLNNQIAEMQLRYTAISVAERLPGVDPHGVDGIYGRESQIATNNFKKWLRSLGLPITSFDSKVGPKTRDYYRFFTP